MKEFYRSLFASPKTIGSVAPSSRFLANRMSSFVPPSSSGVILEVGAGTGVISVAICKRGVNESQLFLIEKDRVLYRFLRKKFPKARVICEDILNFNLSESEFLGQVSCVVSSLPLLSMPVESREKCIYAISELVPDNACLIQFTYHLFKKRIYPREAFSLIKRSLVLGNLPPAMVHVYQKRQRLQ